MAIPTTDININDVKTALGITSNDLASICTSVNINAWSKYKPVSGVFPESGAGLYGLTFPLLSSDGTTWTPAAYTYTKPTDDFRLGDFSGYEHTALPTFYALTSQNTFSYALDTVGEYTTISFIIKVHDLEIGLVRPSPTDLGVENYYIGVRVKYQSGGSWYYKTTSQLKDLNETSGGTIVIDSFLKSANTYMDCPYGIGNLNWELFISDQAKSSWTTTKPTTVYKLPVASGVLASGTIKIGATSSASPASMMFEAQNITDYITSTITTDVYTWSYSHTSTWLTVLVKRAGTEVSAPYFSGDVIWVRPSSVNEGAMRTSVITITGGATITARQDIDPI